MYISRKFPFWMFKCHVCMSGLNAEVSDMRQEEILAAGAEESKIFYYAQCPICGCHNYLPQNMITPWVVQAAEDNSKPKPPKKSLFDWLKFW